MSDQIIRINGHDHILHRDADGQWTMTVCGQTRGHVNGISRNGNFVWDDEFKYWHRKLRSCPCQAGQRRRKDAQAQAKYQAAKKAYGWN